MRPNVTRLVLSTPLAILGLLLLMALGGGIVFFLWNWLLPTLFGWPEITFWQALGLLMLCRILFGGLGLRGGPGSRFRRHWVGQFDPLTQEERERIRQHIRDRLGFDLGVGESRSKSE
ncbi:MAG TPA: hypothetical protein DD490_33755 [Acidobacteria bacterium]|nr:hypothetical protein [Acidobacteriota bacterium]